MKVGVFSGPDEVVIVPLATNGEPIDLDGTLFGPLSGRDPLDYDMEEVDLSGGQSIHIESSMRATTKM